MQLFSLDVAQNRMQVRAMGVIDTILNRVRRPSSKDGDGDAKFASVAEAEAALARLDAARAEARNTRDRHQAERRLLLLRDGTDSEILRLDTQSDRAVLLLERLDAAEREIIDAIADLTAAERHAEAQKICADYWTSLEAFLAAARIATARRFDLIEARAAAPAAGHHGLLQYCEMPARMEFDYEWIDRFERGAWATLSQVIDTRPPPSLFVVTFTRRSDLYSAGETAAFALEQARAWVRSGRAKWAPNQRIPAELPEGDGS